MEQKKIPETVEDFNNMADGLVEELGKFENMFPGVAFQNLTKDFIEGAKDGRAMMSDSLYKKLVKGLAENLIIGGPRLPVSDVRGTLRRLAEGLKSGTPSSDLEKIIDQTFGEQTTSTDFSTGSVDSIRYIELIAALIPNIMCSAASAVANSSPAEVSS